MQVKYRWMAVLATAAIATGCDGSCLSETANDTGGGENDTQTTPNDTAEAAAADIAVYTSGPITRRCRARASAILYASLNDAKGSQATINTVVPPTTNLRFVSRELQTRCPNAPSDAWRTSTIPSRERLSEFNADGTRVPFRRRCVYERSSPTEASREALGAVIADVCALPSPTAEPTDWLDIDPQALAPSAQPPLVKGSGTVVVSGVDTIARFDSSVAAIKTMGPGVSAAPMKTRVAVLDTRYRQPVGSSKPHYEHCRHGATVRRVVETLACPDDPSGGCLDLVEVPLFPSDAELRETNPQCVGNITSIAEGLEDTLNQWRHSPAALSSSTSADDDRRKFYQQLVGELCENQRLLEQVRLVSDRRHKEVQALCGNFGQDPSSGLKNLEMLLQIATNERTREIAAGASWKRLIELARARPDASPASVINLSVGWPIDSTCVVRNDRNAQGDLDLDSCNCLGAGSPKLTPECLTGPARAVLRELRRASCEGVAVVASAGNINNDGCFAVDAMALPAAFGLTANASLGMGPQACQAALTAYRDDPEEGNRLFDLGDATCASASCPPLVLPVTATNASGHLLTTSLCPAPGGIRAPGLAASRKPGASDPDLPVLSGTSVSAAVASAYLANQATYLRKGRTVTAMVKQLQSANVLDPVRMCPTGTSASCHKSPALAPKTERAALRHCTEPTKYAAGSCAATAVPFPDEPPCGKDCLLVPKGNDWVFQATANGKVDHTYTSLVIVAVTRTGEETVRLDPTDFNTHFQANQTYSSNELGLVGKTVLSGHVTVGWNDGRNRVSTHPLVVTP